MRASRCSKQAAIHVFSNPSSAPENAPTGSNRDARLSPRSPCNPGTSPGSPTARTGFSFFPGGRCVLSLARSARMPRDLPCQVGWPARPTLRSDSGFARSSGKRAKRTSRSSRSLDFRFRSLPSLFDWLSRRYVSYAHAGAPIWLAWCCIFLEIERVCPLVRGPLERNPFGAPECREICHAR